MRTITLVNQQVTVPANEIPPVVSAIQASLNASFLPAYGLAPGSVLLAIGADPGPAAERVYLLDDTTQADALGYHELEGQVGVGFVFTRTAAEDGEPWSVVLDHEIKEDITDMLCALGVLAPFAGAPAAFVIYESCDALEEDTYTLGGVPLSNFVLPSWYDPAAKGPVDFLGRLAKPLTLSPGGYVAFTTNMKTWEQLLGAKAPARLAVPRKYSRRSRRLKVSGLPLHHSHKLKG